MMQSCRCSACLCVQIQTQSQATISQGIVWWVGPDTFPELDPMNRASHVTHVLTQLHNESRSERVGIHSHMSQFRVWQGIRATLPQPPCLTWLYTLLVGSG